MKLFAHYDVSGNIKSLTSFKAPQGFSLVRAPRAGEFVAEVEGHDLTDEIPNDKALRKLARDYAIATPLSRCTLARK